MYEEMIYRKLLLMNKHKECFIEYISWRFKAFLPDVSIKRQILKENVLREKNILNMRWS